MCQGLRRQHEFPGMKVICHEMKRSQQGSIPDPVLSGSAPIHESPRVDDGLDVKSLLYLVVHPGTSIRHGINSD